MGANERRWAEAIAEHNRDVAAFVAAMRTVPSDAWTRERAPGQWSPAELALHIAVSYEFGERAARTHEGMEVKVTPFWMWVSKRFFFPLMVSTGWWPRNVKAPKEVRPDRAEAESMTPDAALQRVQRAAATCIAALLVADTTDPPPRVTHAYFGPMTPFEAARMLSMHTRHHTPQSTEQA